MATTDPFSIVLDRLWRILEAHDDLLDLVKAGNRIERAGEERSGRWPRQDADLPTLDIVPAGTSEVEMVRSSSAVEVDQLYDIRIQTGSADETAQLLPIRWHLIRALHGATFTQSWVIRPIRVVLVNEQLADVGEPGIVEAGGRRGWQTVVQVDVRMIFDTTDHIEAADPDLN